MKTNTSSSLPALSVENLASMVPGIVVVYNINTGKYIYANQALQKILGYSPQDFISGGLAFVSSLVHPDDMPVLAEKNQQALNAANKAGKKHTDNEPIISFEYRMRHANGQWIWLQTDGSVYNRNTKGLVEHVINVSINITKRKKAEKRLKRLSEELEPKIK